MKRFFMCIAGLAMSLGLHAAEGDPDQLVKSVTEEVLTIVRADKDIQSGNTKKAQSLIEARVLPHFNFLRMTQLAMGREWKGASPDQQKVIADEFRQLLVRTYSKALTEFRNQTIEYKPFASKPGETDVKVKTVVNQAGGKPIQLDYYLEKSDTVWKVYDIEVAGVSLVTNYRDFFATEIRNGGVDGLIKTMQAKNAAGVDTKK